MKKLLPDYLTEESKTWAQMVLRDYDVMDSEWDTLVLAAQCLDRIASVRKAIKKYGVIVKDRYGVPKQNPAIVIERDQSQLFMKLCKCLKLYKEEDMRGVSYRPRQSKKPVKKKGEFSDL